MDVLEGIEVLRGIETLRHLRMPLPEEAGAVSRGADQVGIQRLHRIGPGLFGILRGSVTPFPPSRLGSWCG